MLYIDIKKACSNKGIDDERGWLRKNGFTRINIHRLMHGPHTNINLKVLEQFCVRMHCTPNEFFSWKPDDTSIAANHPMRKLQPVATEQSINARLRVLPQEKLDALQQFLDTLADT